MHFLSLYTPLLGSYAPPRCGFAARQTMMPGLYNVQPLQEKDLRGRVRRNTKKTAKWEWLSETVLCLSLFWRAIHLINDGDMRERPKPD